MSGINAPSIVTYNWKMINNDNSFLNVSFPFRVRIESIWFTTNELSEESYGLMEGVEGSYLMTDRVVKLAAVKSKNAKNPVDEFDSPNDVGFFFGGFNAYGGTVPEDLKPTLWLGNPDDPAAVGNIGTFAASNPFYNYSLSWRSTAKGAPEAGSNLQSPLFNTSWTEEEFNQKAYTTDMAVMNTDEMLHVFAYGASGDWTGYTNQGNLTIYVAYSGMWNEDARSAPTRPVTDWWNY